MEIRSSNKDKTFVFKITGNSQIRIFNDFESGLINQDMITVKYDYIHLTVRIEHDLELPTKKFYADMLYYKGVPYINCIWDYEEFIPSYVVYEPNLNPIKEETLKLFNIKKDTNLYNILTNIDEYEMAKNERIMDAEYEDNADYWDEYQTNKNNLFKKINYPTIISKFGKIIRLCNKKNFNTLEDDYEITDAFVFDELQYN